MAKDAGESGIKPLDIQTMCRLLRGPLTQETEGHGGGGGGKKKNKKSKKSKKQKGSNPLTNRKVTKIMLNCLQFKKTPPFLRLRRSPRPRRFPYLPSLPRRPPNRSRTPSPTRRRAIPPRSPGPRQRRRRRLPPPRRQSQSPRRRTRTRTRMTRSDYS